VQSCPNSSLRANAANYRRNTIKRHYKLMYAQQLAGGQACSFQFNLPHAKCKLQLKLSLSLHTIIGLGYMGFFKFIFHVPNFSAFPRIITSNSSVSLTDKSLPERPPTSTARSLASLSSTEGDFQGSTAVETRPLPRRAPSLKAEQKIR